MCSTNMFTVMISTRLAMIMHQIFKIFMDTGQKLEFPSVEFVYEGEGNSGI